MSQTINRALDEVQLILERSKQNEDQVTFILALDLLLKLKITKKRLLKGDDNEYCTSIGEDFQNRRETYNNRENGCYSNYDNLEENQGWLY